MNYVELIETWESGRRSWPKGMMMLINSKVLGERIFLVADGVSSEDVRAKFPDHDHVMYTNQETRLLVEASLSSEELRTVHETKKAFGNAKITDIIAKTAQENIKTPLDMGRN